ncbi:DUF3305 domain-containing protein [Ralstonia solanacearum]|uniref:DUF3305 domain-containing protein n=1 Tax=Ralstonia solanacearum TaxID=305 RepID=UPI0005C67165|nr:DUF3305 domain-containing protein [Ralstonia solanacearum]MBB6590640.1 DUF3305 domain-containing protein [Ralstonia solanacearum]MBB6594838.1 DUF3305 domain-containing protein [Ralstonia solanacearum]MDB0540506.1 DUF3305 domain-containing protein [Ralstonia solanacearum]MDB0549614.1 DUF3305 domain-containing protein [Ralstonia solanacearum]MDB0555134.1 DUF3305 domain-containing protein [Ralstonia solanacearum]
MDTPAEPLPTERPSVRMAVVLCRRPTGNRWQPFQWRLEAVVPDLGEFGIAPRCLDRTDALERWLTPGFDVTLFHDEAEGYYLNATAVAPCWFVLWRMGEPGTAQEGRAVPHTVSLSYNEAGRWLDGGETVENVPLDAASLAWLRAYVEQNYRPEPKKRRRPESFLSPEDRAKY